MIELKNVAAGYGKNDILHDFSICFEKGKVTGIIGPNGCGKSTLLKTVLGIIPHRHGTIGIDGINICTLKRNAIAKQIAYLAQGKEAPDMTVEQMVLHGRFPHLSYPRRYTSRDFEIADAAMNTVGINGLAQKRIQSLSGGMRQSVYIAMALAQDTEYIFLDEPTTYLDISHQLALMKLLQKLAGSGKGIVTVLHDLPLAFKFSDEIVVMNEGTMYAAGSSAKICETGVIERIFGVKMLCEDDEYYYKY